MRRIEVDRHFAFDIKLSILYGRKELIANTILIKGLDKFRGADESTQVQAYWRIVE
jgi:hypothetical protein